MDSVEADYSILHSVVLDPFHKACPRSKTIYHIGNHEGWFYEKMKMDTTCRDKFGVENNVDLKRYNMRIVSENGTINFGHLYFTHSTYLNDMHAKKTAQNYRKCIRYGHTHDVQGFMMHSPIDSHEKIVAESIGCLCNLNPSYLEGKPNKWVNAFNVAYIRPDGTFNDYTVIVTDGKFTAPNGRMYK